MNEAEYQRCVTERRYVNIRIPKRRMIFALFGQFEAGFKKAFPPGSRVESVSQCENTGDFIFRVYHLSYKTQPVGGTNECLDMKPILVNRPK